jgi:hypothetical protein
MNSTIKYLLTRRKIFIFFSSKIRFLHSSNISFNNNNDPKKKNQWKIILGKDGSKKVAHKIAQDCLKKCKTPTANIINDILSHEDVNITNEELIKLIKLPKFNINTSNIEIMIKEIKNLIGSSGSKTQIPGVYIFTHIKTGSKYVGSSSQLAIRLNSYIKKKNLKIGLFIPLLDKEGINSFFLDIIPMNGNWKFKAELVLEQYYLLNPSFNLNTIKVANNPSASNAKPLYMYNRDKTILYYFSFQQKDFINNLNIHFCTFYKHLKNNTYYLGKYSFSRELIETASISDMSILDLALKLQEDRIRFNKNKPINNESKAILLTSLINPNEKILFYGIRPCINYLKKEKGFPSTRETLIKYININKPYHGYLCQYV